MICLVKSNQQGWADLEFSFERRGDHLLQKWTIVMNLRYLSTEESLDQTVRCIADIK